MSMSWLLYAFSAMVILGAATLAAKAVSGFELSLSALAKPSALLVIAAYAVFSIVGAALYILALREQGSKTAIVAALVSLNVALVAVVAYYMYAESLSLMQLAGIILAIISVFLISLS